MGLDFLEGASWSPLEAKQSPLPGLAAPSWWLWQQPPLPHFYCRAVERPAFRTGTWASCQSPLLSPADASAVSLRAVLMELGQENGEGVCVQSPLRSKCLGYAGVCIQMYLYLLVQLCAYRSVSDCMCLFYPCFV